MRLTITLPDDLADHYRREADERDLDVEGIVEARLAVAAPLDPRRRYLLVHSEELEAVEAVAGNGGHLLSGAQLATNVKRLAAIKFGEHELTLTPGQLEELAFRAEKIGTPLPQLIQAAWDRFAQDFFQLVP